MYIAQFQLENNKNDIMNDEETSQEELNILKQAEDNEIKKLRSHGQLQKKKKQKILD
jgi:hypothetical protein